MHLTRLLLTTLLVATASATSVAPAAAQGSCGDRDQGNYTVTLSPGAVVFPEPQASHFFAGQIVLPTPLQIAVDPQSGVGNNTWYMCIRTTAANLGGNGKPLADLQFFNSQTSSWISLSSSFAQLGTFSGMSATTIVVPMRVLLSWADDSPGTYGPTDLVLRFSR